MHPLDSFLVFFIMPSVELFDYALILACNCLASVQRPFCYVLVNVLILTLLFDINSETFISMFLFLSSLFHVLFGISSETFRFLFDYDIILTHDYWHQFRDLYV